MLEAQRNNFDTLCRAIRNGDAALVECRNGGSADCLMVICAINRLDGGRTEYVPFAQLLDQSHSMLELPPVHGNRLMGRPEDN